MSGNLDVEAQLRRHLAAEADELPFLPDGETVRERLAERRRRPWRLLALVPMAAAFMLAVLLGQALLAGPGPDESGGPVDWGPLAVVPTAGGAEALNTGTLRITQSCVFLETAGGESDLLVWPADRTRWEATAGTIGFTNSDGAELTLRDGEPVSFSGGGDSTAEGGVSGEEWLARVDWVARPDPSCGDPLVRERGRVSQRRLLGAVRRRRVSGIPGRRDRVPGRGAPDGRRLPGMG